jgi:3-hydroxyisobutyrate dehydrogenase
MAYPIRKPSAASDHSDLTGRNPMKIAFLGLGHMGRELAAHAIDAGHSLIVWNRTSSATDELVGRGAERAESPSAAVEAADLALTVLFDGNAVREVVMSANPPIPAGAVWTDVTRSSPPRCSARTRGS